MPTHASALAIGHRLQEYIIGRLLGHGGFGLTYLAQDTNLNSLVAIKEFLPQEFAVRNADNSVVPKSEFDADSYSWGLDRFKEELHGSVFASIVVADKESRRPNQAIRGAG